MKIICYLKLNKQYTSVCMNLKAEKVVTTFTKTKKQQFDLTFRRIMAKLATKVFVFKFRELLQL